MIQRLYSKIKHDGFRVTFIAMIKFLFVRFRRILSLCIPPILPMLYKRIFRGVNSAFPKLPTEFSNLPRAEHALFKLIKDYNFETVLDIGSGSGEHASVLAMHGKKVTALDFGTSIYAQVKKGKLQNIDSIEVDFHKFEPKEKFDCVWASHVLEHQPDPGVFIRKCAKLVKSDGMIAITVPPLKDEIVGGHLTLWNAGLLLYQMVFNGLDCRNAAVCTYGYNVTVIVQMKERADVELTWDNGDIHRLKEYFPSFIDEPFDGRISRWNW